jgi:hypothetical protein
VKYVTVCRNLNDCLCLCMFVFDYMIMLYDFRDFNDSLDYMLLL